MDDTKQIWQLSYLSTTPPCHDRSKNEARSLLQLISKLVWRRVYSRIIVLTSFVCYSATGIFFFFTQSYALLLGMGTSKRIFMKPFSNKKKKTRGSFHLPYILFVRVFDKLSDWSIIPLVHCVILITEAWYLKIIPSSLLPNNLSNNLCIQKSFHQSAHPKAFFLFQYPDPNL